jgi:hypothetical protein
MAGPEAGDDFITEGGIESAGDPRRFVDSRILAPLSTRGAVMNEPALVIEHIITSDDPTGAPWPPDGSVSIVRRLGGWTVWRRLHLTILDSTQPLRPDRPSERRP